MSNLDKLHAAFVEALDVDPSGITDSYSYGDDKWDSVAHMALVVSIEAQFDIMMETDDVIDLSSVGKAKEILAKYGIIV
ncbi:MAG: acyl carrier protein [Ignavibacteria bacterium]|jgi:acyl carrier protein|nr:acyl carrier protein [Ignavibacteria bacterium]